MGGVEASNLRAKSVVTSLRRRSPEVVERLSATADRIAPVMLAQQRRLVVAPAVSRVLPDGLQRGSTIGVRGPAAASLAFAVAAGPAIAGSWVATIGCDELGLVGAEQAGMPLQRMVMVAQPSRSSWAVAAAALVDAFDVVMVASSYSIRSRDARRLLSRARERGGVIIDTTQCWPEAHDVVLEVASQQWVGLGEGHGVLEARKVSIEVSGRRGERPRTVPLWLPGPQGIPEILDPTYAGADIVELVDVDSEGPAVPLRRVV